MKNLLRMWIVLGLWLSILISAKVPMSFGNAYYNVRVMASKKSIIKDASLQYHYDFNDLGTAPANRAANGTAHTLTPSSGATIVVDSQRGAAIDFDGTVNGTASAVSNKGLVGASDKTLSVWLRIRRMSGNIYSDINRIVSWGTTATNGAAVMLLINGGVFQVGFGGSANYSVVRPVFDWVWHHVVVSIRSGQAYIYIDGVQDGTYTIGSYNTASDQDLTFGNLYNGRLDDFMVFNKGLLATEVTQLFNLQKSTRAANCSATAQCDDGNSCSDEVCSAGKCQYTPNNSCNPRTCEDAVYAKGLSATGSTTLYAYGNAAKPFTATCTVEEVTKTYMDLAATSSSTSCSKTENNSFCNYPGNVTTYTKVAFSPELMAVYTRGDDGRYATTTGSRVIFGGGTACTCTSSEASLGKGFVNLTGTPFSMPANNLWIESGWQVYYNIAPAPSSQGTVTQHQVEYYLPATSTVSFSAGGCCGGSAFPGGYVISVTYP